LDSVGINRREVVNERVVQERVATILSPSRARAHCKGALEALEKKHPAEPPNRGVGKPGQGIYRLGIPKV